MSQTAEVPLSSSCSKKGTDTQIGGRTAWSTIAVINNIQYPARFWYDGSRMEQAKEDAAEFALGVLEKAKEEQEKQRQSGSHYHHSLAA